MSTRGFVGFVSGAQRSTVYNHYDSYPSGLGAEMLSWLHRADLEFEAVRAAELRVVSDAVPPSAADLERLARYHDPGVGGEKGPTWYQLLCGTQGRPDYILEAGVYEDATGFPDDSLFCEWGYLVDFDTQVFEVYKGFQHEPHRKGRFATENPTRGSVGANPYYPVALVASWPLGALPNEEVFLREAVDRGDGITHAMEQVSTLASEL